ncbi:MAG: M48 family metalloprotease [Proteobacteria bacterium]|nr:M48 family metalloprotease [Pseudomonadota bacterium]
MNVKPSRRALAACTILCGSLAFSPVADASLFGSSSGYPKSGKAIDNFQPAVNYSDVIQGRPRSLGIMRARAQGFVPSPELHDYVKSVLMRVLAGEQLPPSFQPEVRVLAAPEFTALCTPDGTIVVTIGLLELLENEDELAFVLAHEVSHAILRHHDSDWYKKSQYYMVVNGAAVDTVAKKVSFNIGGVNTGEAYEAATHLYKLSGNVLAPQHDPEQEDQADALGFDLMVKAGYDPDAAISVMDKLAQQEAEAAAAVKDAQDSKKKEGKGDDDDDIPTGLTSLSIGGLTFGESQGTGIASLAMSLFNSAVDSMSDEATSHHPAKERIDLLSNYEFREYRDLRPRQPTPLAWSPDSKLASRPVLTNLLDHYSRAEDAAEFVAAKTDGTTPPRPEPVAKAALQKSTGAPTQNHAYTQFVAYEYYDYAKQPTQSEASLEAAVNGPEPSWEVYARLTDIHIQRKDYAGAQKLMDQAVTRFDNSPVLLPKRIEVLEGQGRDSEAKALLPQCKGYDIPELYDQCQKYAAKS